MMVKNSRSLSEHLEHSFFSVSHCLLFWTWLIFIPFVLLSYSEKHAFPSQKNKIYLLHFSGALFRCSFQDSVTPRTKTDKELSPALPSGFV